MRYQCCACTRDHGKAIDDRASIIAFITAKAKRFTHAAEVAERVNTIKANRLFAEASAASTIAMQIARGDDMPGCDRGTVRHHADATAGRYMENVRR